MQTRRVPDATEREDLARNVGERAAPRARRARRRNVVCPILAAGSGFPRRSAATRMSQNANLLDLLALHDKTSVNVGVLERLFSLGLGTRCLRRALKSRRSVALVTAAGGAFLTYRALTGRCPVYRRSRLVRDERVSRAPLLTRAIRVGASTAIEAPPEQVHRFWRRLGPLTEALDGVWRVEILDERTSRWILDSGRKPRSLTVRILEDEGGRIVWEAVDGGPFAHRGSVEFLPDRGGRTTRLILDATWFAPPTALALVGRAARASPAAQARKFLRGVKELIEAGELPRSGEYVRARRRRPAHPRARRELESARIDLASEGSFPASDPPSWTPVTSIGASSEVAPGARAGNRP